MAFSPSSLQARGYDGSVSSEEGQAQPNRACRFVGGGFSLAYLALVSVMFGGTPACDTPRDVQDSRGVCDGGCGHLDGECTDGVGGPTSGSCTASPANEGALCSDDGDACNGVSRCRVGACAQAVAPVSCADLDGECTVGVWGGGCAAGGAGSPLTVLLMLLAGAAVVWIRRRTGRVAVQQ